MFSKRRNLLLLAALVAFWGVCTTGVGCHSLSPGKTSGDSRQETNVAAQQPAQSTAAASKTAPSVAVLAPRNEVVWSIEAATGLPKAGVTGRDMVASDGSLSLGPYGSVKVAGLTPNQAAAAVQHQVRSYLKEPKVRLRVLPPEDAGTRVTQVAHRVAVQWNSDERDNQVVATSWEAAQQGAVQMIGPGPSLSPVAEGQPAGDGPKKDEALKDEKTPNGAARRGDPPTALAAGLEHPFFGPHGAPHEGIRRTLPPYRMGPPDILQIESLKGLITQKVEGPHLVRPDGTVGLGAYGSAYVAGLTIEEAKDAIARVIYARLNPEQVKLKDVVEGLSVDVLAYNSKVYYVITDGAGNGDQVTRLPITGNETVLDAISNNVVRPGANGLPPVASKKHIWVARPGPEGKEQILPVDWLAITQHASVASNYQLLPGDRVYVKADKLRTINTAIDKFLSPIERILGVTLLGSQTVNSIRSGGTTTTVP